MLFFSMDDARSAHVIWCASSGDIAQSDCNQRSWPRPTGSSKQKCAVMAAFTSIMLAVGSTSAIVPRSTTKFGLVVVCRARPRMEAEPPLISLFEQKILDEARASALPLSKHRKVRWARKIVRSVGIGVGGVGLSYVILPAIVISTIAMWIACGCFVAREVGLACWRRVTQSGRYDDAELRLHVPAADECAIDDDECRYRAEILEEHSRKYQITATERFADWEYRAVVTRGQDRMRDMVERAIHQQS